MQAVDELWQLQTHLRSISDIYSNISSPDNPLPNPAFELFPLTPPSPADSFKFYVSFYDAFH